MKTEKICVFVCVLMLVFIMALLAGVVCAGTFLKVTGVEGESRDSEHEGWIDVLSYSGSLIQPGSAITGTSRSRGSVSMGDITVTKVIDKATPKLNEALLRGTILPKVELERRDSGKSTIYTLKDVIIASITKSGSNEIVRFRFKSGTYAVLLSK
jgi:type VI secretion system Hcp family effector